MIRCLRLPGGRWNSVFSWLKKVKARPGFTSATLKNASMMCLSSSVFDFRKFLRAGTLKNRFFTLTVVPFWQFTGDWPLNSVPSTTTAVPTSSSCRFVLSSTCAMEAMDASASPRNPMVRMAIRSSAFWIFEVAWRSKHIRASRSDMPQPLSATWISNLPESLIISLISVAPASMVFSSNSLTAEAGR